ncbi:MAG: BatD family protein [Thermodesulfobacteriota bacterium]|nr:BatD family protein [Thermodesulfobacteriota bacterium]
MRIKSTLICLILLNIILVLNLSAYGSEISVEAVVERQDAFVGEAIPMQIQVNGHESPDKPDVSNIADFTVQFRGGRQNSSTSITNINGKWSRISKHGFIFNYLLTPKRAGQLTFPPVSLTLDGIVYTSRPLTIYAKKPEETDDFKLRLNLSQDKCYVGEPVTLTTTWYIGKDVKKFEFILPLLDDTRFEVVNPIPASQGINSQDEFEITLGDATVIGRRSKGRLDGKSYTTLSFQQIVIPRQNGDLTLPQATVGCLALSGYSRQRQRNRSGPFANDDFFNDFFNQGAQKTYETVITPSNQPRLTVSPLPEAGRPENFNGPVGEFTISAQAAPTQVNVGDPITLTLTVSGPLANRVKLPNLHHLAETGFKIPEEISPGESTGQNEIFIQTIRARNDQVTEIPAIHLSYFNPRTKKYETASSSAIALSVQSTRIITAQDAEGGAHVMKRKIKSIEDGINFNYDDATVLVSQGARQTSSISTWLILTAPPGFFAVLFLSTFLMRRRKKDPAALRAQQAFTELNNKLSSLEDSGKMIGLAMALKTYLGHKLRRPPGALTFRDVEHILRKRNLDSETLKTLKEILDQREACRYSGGTTAGEESHRLIQQTRAVAVKLEEKL